MWFLRKRRPQAEHVEPVDPWRGVVSPFDKEEITPDDPEWALFAPLFRKDNPPDFVSGTFDGRDGRIVEVNEHHDETDRRSGT